MLKKQSATSEVEKLLEFMFRLGRALLACGEQTAKVELVLRRTAAAYGMRQSRIVAFPTAIFISLHDGAEERVTLAEGPTQSLRLDQIADVYELGDKAQAGAVAPSEGLNRLAAILRKTPRFGRAGVVAGHTILSVGLAMVLVPTLTNIVVVAVLGAIVGGLKVLRRDQPVLAVPLPVAAAIFVSALVFFAVKQGAPVEILDSLVPPLVTFLPGAMLTLGMVELAYGDMVSGSSRLVTGFVQLVLLALGLAAGAMLVGYHPESIFDASTRVAVDAGARWIMWAGVVIFGAGAFLHFSAPRNSFFWMMLVLIPTFVAQQIAAKFVGNEFSGFFGMLVATPLGYLIQMRFKGPPAMVTFLPSFWLLVPGALGLVSVKHMLSDRAAGLDGMISTVFVFASIALGTLVGASLYKWLTEQFGWWQLQIGRAGRYIRRRKDW